MRKAKRENNSRKGKGSPSSRQSGVPGYRKYSDSSRNLHNDNAGINNGYFSNARINGYEKRSLEIPWDGAD